MSMGRGRWYQSPSLSAIGAYRVWKSGSDSGSGVSATGESNWCSKPSSGTWKLTDMLKIALPCWMATTRRVVNVRPSRMRSTS